MSPRNFLLFAAAIGLFYFSALGTVPLLEPDEARYAEIPREMLASGDFVTPRLNGVAYLEKPPLFYWGNALSLRLFGETEFAARFFTAAVSAAGVLLTFWMGSALSGWRTGLYSAIVLSTSLYYYVIGRLNTLDMTLAVTLLLAIFPAYLYLSGRRAGRGWLVLSYLGSALAFLTKGLVGVVFPGAILLVWSLLSRRHREIGRAVSLPGIAVFAAVTVPWLAAVQARNPDFLWFFFVREQLLRYTTTIHHRTEPFWFFVPIVAGGFVPWIAFLRRAALAVRGSVSDFFEREDLVFLFTWALFIFLFFSASRSKLPTYAAPMIPPVAVLFGRALEMWALKEDGSVRCRFPLALSAVLAFGILWAPSFARAQSISQSDWVGIAAVPALLILLWGLVPLFVRRLGAERIVLVSFLVLALFLTSLNRPAAVLLGERKSVKGLAEALSTSLRPGDVVVQYGIYRQGVPFYARCRTVLVEDMNELEYGLSRAPDRDAWYLGAPEFLRLWQSGRRVFCVLGRDAMPFVREKLPGHRLLYRSRAGILVVNRF